MKIKLMTALAFAFALVQMTASAQTGSDPTGYVTYSLPQTVLSLEVEAVRETRLRTGRPASILSENLCISRPMLCLEVSDWPASFHIL